MKLVIISDTHSLHEQMAQIPEGDILIHCGDVTNYGEDHQLLAFIEWFVSHPHPHKVFIPGNHDRGLQYKHTLIHNALQNLPEGVHYLEDSGAEIMGIKFWGTPWTPASSDWSFMTHSLLEARKQIDLIPEDTEILITHGPPYTVLDTIKGSRKRTNFGCPELLSRIKSLPDLRLHAFGHVHSPRGRKQTVGNTLCVNASICNMKYMPGYRPLVVERYFDSMNRLHYQVV